MSKVLFVATVGGFVSQFEMNDVRILQDKSCEVHYAANFENNVYYVEKDLYENNHIETHNVPMAKSPFNIFKNYKAYKYIKRLIDSEDISVVHCHTPVGGVLARLAAARSKKKPKVIYTAHGFHFFKGGPLVNWCIYYPVERLMARATDVLVTINEEDYQRACKFKLRPDGKVYKLPGVGIDLDRYNMEINNSQKTIQEREALETATQEKEVQENLAQTKDKSENRDFKKIKKLTDKERKPFKIVSVSEINKNKNHKVVIQAVKKLIDEGNVIYYDIYGKGSNEENLRKYIKKLDLEEYVTLKGYISEPKEVLVKADCFAFPSIREGLGMSALEAMACGLPVIARENRGTKEYMVNGHNGIVCKTDDFKEYAAAILKIKDSVETRKTMGRNAKETVKKFSIAHSEVIMKQVYENFI